MPLRSHCTRLLQFTALVRSERKHSTASEHVTARQSAADGLAKGGHSRVLFHESGHFACNQFLIGTLSRRIPSLGQCLPRPVGLAQERACSCGGRNSIPIPIPILISILIPVPIRIVSVARTVIPVTSVALVRVPLPFAVLI